MLLLNCLFSAYNWNVETTKPWYVRLCRLSAGETQKYFIINGNVILSDFVHNIRIVYDSRCWQSLQIYVRQTYNLLIRKRWQYTIWQIILYFNDVLTISNARKYTYSDKTPVGKGSVKMTSVYLTPVSYTHLDVYKRQS